MNLRILLLGLLIAITVWQCRAAETVTLGSGVKVDKAPLQTRIENAESFEFKDYLITPLADFSLEAKVLSRESYWLDKESDIAPTDLALGWQTMSDEAVLTAIDIRQSDRWYHWRVERFPVPRRTIETQSANMHIVPANEHVERILASVKPGQIIRLDGQLIKVQGYDGWKWQSSLTREDTGAGACELVYVNELNIISE